MYQQLYRSISTAIKNGNLPNGTVLPSIRRLSGDLSLSRTTIESAYQQLCVEGYIINKPQSGYYVNIDVSSNTKKQADPQIPLTNLQIQNRIIYNFGSDSIDSETADVKLWRSYIKDILKKQNKIISYGDPQGEPELRNAISLYSYTVRGVVCSSDTIVIGAGTQPILWLLCGMLRQYGKKAAIEKGGFSKAEQIFRDCNFTVEHISGNDDGIDTDELYRSGAKILFVNPSGNLITGQPMKMNKRYELLYWAEQCGGIIIEDDYNGELRFTSRPIPAMASMDNEKVIYIGSFSKLLLPSVRIGYTVLPQSILNLYQPKAKLYNQTASKTEQLALARYIKERQLDRQLRRLRKTYAEKYRILCEALKNQFGDDIKITLHENSLSLILLLKDAIPDIEEKALSKGLKITCLPVDNSSVCAVRLSFSGIPVNDIIPAVKILKEIYDEREAK